MLSIQHSLPVLYYTVFEYSIINSVVTSLSIFILRVMNTNVQIKYVMKFGRAPFVINILLIMISSLKG